MRQNVLSPQIDSRNGIDMGDITGSMYSEKKLVKARSKEVFELPLVEYTNTPTQSVELEAFKSKTD